MSRPQAPTLASHSWEDPSETDARRKLDARRMLGARREIFGQTLGASLTLDVSIWPDARRRLDASR